MILITGGTGFIGQVLTRQLVEAGHEVRLLIRPSPTSPQLPRGVSVHVAVSSLQDARGLDAALVGVDTVFHLVGGEWSGSRANLLEIDIQGTQAIAKASAQAGVKRLFAISHLGADRASAYPVLKTKGIVEEHVRRSGVDYTIIRAGLVFGPRDGLTNGLAQLLHAIPFVFFLPGEGDTLTQPLWVEDLATSLVWALDDDRTRNQIIEIGGPEYLTFREIVQIIIDKIGLERRLLPMRPPYLRALTVTLDATFSRLPISVFWLDYLAANRTCSLDTLPRTFGLMPSRFSQRLDYLEDINWRRELWRSLFRRRE